ncbi:hypothetical protein PHYSODRAFT_288656 [Phytophthora sojae]|uniref:Uncharacterized protein n=1 Tax=Phytophthora sojae (strain P6497) TaxID=1094619 RepID=G5A6I5_PHYSP|nr:hypothetical protein PHYSODRAFT_288656 [Phytophthora sojae]EGZ08940.1 hypothetical protein PHYSODRAFT_288656 [Phytophthora sojae]|eukprot:XP_009535573.1 hypothetical protein PHYSODRAFT_288656 [Phytophthora sojae]
MPYSAEKTAQVMWNVMDLGAVPDGQLNIVKRSDNLMVSDGCFTNQLDCGGVVEIRSRCVMKRFLVPEGFIVMIEGVSEWLVRPSCSEEWRHVTRDSGWGIVHPVAEGGLCQLQTGLHLQENEWGLKMSDVSHKTPSLLSRGVGEVMIPSFRKIIESRHQLVDNKLLDSSL